MDYPENTPIGNFKDLYCYNDNPEEKTFFYSGENYNINQQYRSGFEGSRRSDVNYRTDVYNGPVENPFDRNKSYDNEPSNPWAQHEDPMRYQNGYPNGYFETTKYDRPTDHFDGSRRNDKLPINNGCDQFGYDSNSYENPQQKSINGYSYNNPYAPYVSDNGTAFGMEISGFERSVTSNWDNTYVEERPIPPQINPWKNAYEHPYDNRREAFESSLQPAIPQSNDDPYANWEGYAEKNFPNK